MPRSTQMETQGYLKAYNDGSHHADVKMDYGTQTGSEYFKLNGSDVDLKWQDEDANTTDDFTWATSREYLINEKICTTSQCLAFDTTSSLELMWLGLGSEQAAIDIRDGITDMQLHLSDEARGLPPVGEVPVPAAFWLFGTAIFGLIGMRCKAKSAA